MSDPIVDEVVTKEPEDWNNVDIVVKDEPEESREELIARIKATEDSLKTLQGENEDLKKKGSTEDVIASGLKKIGDSLSTRPVQQPVAKKEESLDLDQLNKNFFDDPVKSGTQLIDHLQGKKLEELSADLMTMNLNLSKREAMDNSNYSWIFENPDYAKQVEAIVQNTPAKVKRTMRNIYTQAAGMIAGANIEAFKQHIMEKQEEAKTANGSKESVPHTEVSSVTAPTNGKKKVVITPEIKARMDKLERLGMDGRELLRFLK